MAIVASIPPPSPDESTGLNDLQWITDVRAALRDYPESTTETIQADGTNGVVAYNSMPFKTARRPIYDGSLIVYDQTASTNYTVITTGTPSAGQVLANYDTGELVFSTPPASGHVIYMHYQFCKWRDQDILTALYAGLRAMFPSVGKTQTDTSISIQVNVWDYTLPVWAQDPRSRIFNIEIKDPYIPTEPWRPLAGGFHRVNLTTIHIPRAQQYSPVARLRIVGWGPYLTLGDLEPQLYHLPIWYALSVLLPKQESFRIRQDTMVPLTQEGGQQPGLLTQTGDYYAKRFELELQRLSRLMGPGYNLPIRTSYDFKRHF